MPFTLNANEYLANLTNLCLQVLTFDSLNFTNRFGVFGRKYTEWGDKLACVNAWVADGENYSLGTASFDDPYGADKPVVVETTITTRLKKRYSLQLAEDLLRGAFEDSNSLQAFLAVLMKQLRTKSEIDIYNQVIADFGALTVPAVNAGASITGTVDTEANIKAVYTAIMQRAHEMKLPNLKYGMVKKASDGSTTQQVCAEGDRLILFLTPEWKSKFDTYINASLLNSSEIDLYKVFDEIRVVDVADNTTLSTVGTVKGWMCTDDVYRYSPRIQTIRNNPNGANLTMNYFYHVWTNMGFTNAGQLSFIGTPVPASPST